MEGCLFQEVWAVALGTSKYLEQEVATNGDCNETGRGREMLQCKVVFSLMTCLLVSKMFCFNHSKEML